MAEQSEAEKIEAEITTYPTIRDDLNRVRSNEFSKWGKTPLIRLMDELIEAVKLAEPLPEGWVLYETPSGSQAVLWHRDGKLFQWKDDEAHWSTVESVGRHRLTPFPSAPTPAVTQSDTVLVDMSPWPTSTSTDWRKEAKILREAKSPSHAPSAALVDAVADALEKVGR